MSKSQEIKKRILELTKEYYKAEHYENQHKPFVEGDHVNYAGRVFDEKEMVNLVDASLDFWLTTGPYTEKFEKGMANYLGVKYCSLVNSGSSANLIALMTLTSPKLGARRIQKGDEVITVAAGFPTTIAPILQAGAVPVFVDITLPGYNIDTDMLEQALSDKTKAVMIAHTLGNPFDLQKVRDFCDAHNLWLVEDNCDALGSQYCYNGEWKQTGTIGHIGTSSFYPPHHITMGEGGAVYTDDPILYRLINSFRDWGRDCWCKSGRDGSCNHRYDGQYGELPFGYDHKYVYSHFGYNLKATDMQAAIGCAQLDKIDEFARLRKEHWTMLREGLADLEDKLLLPDAMENSKPSWFGFLMMVKDDAGFTRDDIVRYLESNHIQTRNLFAGNIVKQPCFDEMRVSGEGYRVVGSLENTDKVMTGAFWIGVYPGMNEAKIEYMIRKIHEFVQTR